MAKKHRIPLRKRPEMFIIYAVAAAAAALQKQGSNGE